MTIETTNPADVKINFSDYVGEKLSEVPVAFLKWNLQRNRHLEPEMRAAMKAVIEMQEAGKLPAGRRDVFLNTRALKPGDVVMVDAKIGNFLTDRKCTVLVPAVMNHVTLHPEYSSFAITHVNPAAILRKI